ncbi:hypothetical protein TVAG_001930 [Trichomonas vaginalis G3]|uniref:Uncharacterized protein n=1 Tax=Trichomonas vaginalis (strain ATCC PRA-98 / G3) TaxID=412133 RepID=A2FTX8_TRIV3|nr:hypothetical protein TVAGG3_0130340 [Trichomonas vaginalis G3]EAX91641.1 hypothetical protein TVAG_001930 [Trichomonas vaginalis G3]KAI5546053.1 hypothetical protein TVAGG3_0130340 [Trichomonas vaginalis G3]|eukprot:XP_001304571.1 hypothetical protein [Trichomonas vaginalis G3]
MSATEVECEREFSFVTNLFDIHATRASAQLIENKMKGSYMKRYNQLKEYATTNNLRRPYNYSELFERYDSVN